jgi:predicted small metal-binding protein
MKSLACRDVGQECDFRAEGESAEELKRLFYEHVGEAHMEFLADMTEQQKREFDETMDTLLG